MLLLGTRAKGTKRKKNHDGFAPLTRVKLRGKLAHTNGGGRVIITITIIVKKKKPLEKKLRIVKTKLSPSFSRPVRSKNGVLRLVPLATFRPPAVWTTTADCFAYYIMYTHIHTYTVRLFYDVFCCRHEIINSAIPSGRCSVCGVAILPCTTRIRRFFEDFRSYAHGATYRLPGQRFDCRPSSPPWKICVQREKRLRGKKLCSTVSFTGRP